MPIYSEALTGVDLQRAPLPAELNETLDKDKLPATFPVDRWNEQAQRYIRYWRWFTGEELNEAAAVTSSGETVYKFPLHINAIRNFARKHAALLIGQGPDEPYPPIQAQVSPLKPWDGSEPSDDNKHSAKMMENLINVVWTFSGGRALQMEAATMLQFLGGYVFKVNYVPDMAKDLPIPITVEGYSPDFFLPVWGSRDPWWLHEAFLVYRIPGLTAAHEYGTKTQDKTWVIYCEHWTRDQYGIYIDGEPITVNGRTYDKQTNPFGFVPFVYIPHLREGNFFGSSHVPDVEGLLREYNARMADEGDAIHDSVHRERYARNLGQDPKQKQLGTGRFAIDLGQTNPATKAQPDVWVEDPPNLSPALVEFTRDTLWTQLLREGQLGPVAFGEDEGSQRSGLTLAIRFWPSTSHTHVERSYWIDGLRVLDTMILTIMRVKKLLEKDGVKIPEDFRRHYVISQRWQNMIPRDREQEVNENVLLSQSNLRSKRKAITDLGGIRSVEDELDEIKDDMTFEANLAAIGSGPNDPNGGSGPATDVVAPIASSGLSDKE